MFWLSGACGVTDLSEFKKLKVVELDRYKIEHTPILSTINPGSLETLRFIVFGGNSWNGFISDLEVLDEKLGGRQLQFHLTLSFPHSEHVMAQADTRLQNLKTWWNITIDSVYP